MIKNTAERPWEKRSSMKMTKKWEVTVNGTNNVINAAYPRYAYPCFTTANNPNCAIANAKNVKISVAMAFLTKCPFCLSCSDLI